MNYSAIASASSAVLLVCVALILLGISRAPGWDRAGVFARVAATAAAYTACDFFLVSGNFSPATQLWVSRVQFSAGALHGAAWLRFALALRTPRERLITYWITACHLIAVAAVVPGAMLDATWRIITVEAVGARFTAFALTTLGSLAGAMILVGMAVAFTRVARHGAQSTPITPLGRLGFALFYGCAAADFLTAAGVLELAPLGGTGFLAALLPMALYMMRAFVANARRLDRLSNALAREVQERTHEVIEAHRALAEAERHATVGRVAAGVAHEINNPLAWLMLNADLLRDYDRSHALPAEVQESITGVLDGADRIRAAVESLRARTRWSPGMRVSVAPDRILRIALKSAATELHQSHELVVEIGDTPLVSGDESELMGAFADLLAVARAGGAQGRAPGRIRITGGTAADGWADFHIHAVRTVDPDEADVYTAVSAAQAVIERHGGAMSVRESEAHREISVRLPPSQEQVTPEGRIARLSLASMP